MNIEPLYKLKERLNTSAVAGISLMPEDFRLKQAIDQVEPLSKAVPIFGKIYQGALHILEVPEEQRANALLDELALVDAVLVTQASAGMDGELSAISSEIKETIITTAPYSKAAPILEALTTSGSGHYSLVIDSYRESPEIFRDFRLRSALVDGLGAGYSVLADEIEQWLSKEDESMLPLLKRGFLPDGKSEMVRRVRVIENIAKEKENSWYLTMLDTAKKEVRETLIYALRHEKENEELLFNLVKTEKGKNKKAAIWALSYMESEKIYQYFRDQLQCKKDSSDAFLATQKKAGTFWEDGYFYLTKSEQVSNIVAENINQWLDFLEKQAAGGNVLVDMEARIRIRKMFTAMVGKTSDAMLAVYKRLAGAKIFDELKNAEGKNSRFSLPYVYRGNESYPVKYIDRMLSKSILFTKSPKLYQLAQELYQEYGEAFLSSALLAALLSKEGEEVFSEFSFYLVQDGEKENAEKKAGRLAIMEAFSYMRYDEEQDAYILADRFQEPHLEKEFIVKEKIYGKFDLRWIELLTDNKIKKDGDFTLKEGLRSDFDTGYYSDAIASWDSVLERMVCPKDERNCALLGKYFYNRALYGGKGRFSDCFRVMKKCHMTFELEDLIHHVKQMGKKSYWDFERLMISIPMTVEKKKEALEEIKKMMERKEVTFNGRAISLEELENRISSGCE